MAVCVTIHKSQCRALTPTAIARLRRRTQRMVRAATLADQRLDERELEVGLTLTNDAEIKELNRSYRGKDKSTDVLAFAMRDGAFSEVSPQLLGDVVISVETARRQAKRSQTRRTLEQELMFLWAHGLCHLLGYDHGNNSDERQMKERMQRLLDESQARGKTRAA